MADVAVYGDEVESVLTAVSAARCGVRVILVRRSQELLGGLSTRGGLSYMDITPECKSPLFEAFTRQAGVIRVGLEPNRAHRVLQSMLQEAEVTVLSGVEAQWESFTTGAFSGWRLGDGSLLQARQYIDATPDADLARAAGVPYLRGLGGVLGDEQDYLAVSPVFQIEGVPKEDLMAFEASLRERAEMSAWLEQALPYHPQALRAEYLTRPCFSPEGMDYLDVLNPVIGIAYHHWRHGDVATYPTAETWIDGANISLLLREDGTVSMGFNGMVSQLLTRRSPYRADPFAALLALSQGGAVPQALLEEMAAFETYLRTMGGMVHARVVAPQEMYVRQTLTLLSRENMTAAMMLQGGVPEALSIGTFSYWLDLRGTQLWKRYPGEHLPKPVFRVGLDVALPPEPMIRSGLHHFAFVGRSAGYSPIGQGAGRIVQHNSLLGEGVGIAAAMAVQAGSTLAEVSPKAVRAVMVERQLQPMTCTAQAVWDEAQIQASDLLRADAEAIDSLRVQTLTGQKAL